MARRAIGETDHFEDIQAGECKHHPQDRLSDQAVDRCLMVAVYGALGERPVDHL